MNLEEIIRRLHVTTFHPVAFVESLLSIAPDGPTPLRISSQSDDALDVTHGHDSVSIEIPAGRSMLRSACARVGVLLSVEGQRPLHPHGATGILQRAGKRLWVATRNTSGSVLLRIQPDPLLIG